MRCTQTGANRRRKRFVEARQRHSPAFRLRQVRWGRRATRPADSREPPVKRPRSARSPIFHESSRAKQGPRSCRTEPARRMPDDSTKGQPAPTGRKGLGLAACTAVVVGNMVGSGFYLSPVAVAPYGLLSVVVWALMGLGAICLGLTFARLAGLAPATGGPYAYTRPAHRALAGVLVL